MYQSKISVYLEVKEVMTLYELIKSLCFGKKILLDYSYSINFKLFEEKLYFNILNSSIGYFSEKKLNFIYKNNFVGISLRNNISRYETSVFVILYLIFCCY